MIYEDEKKILSLPFFPPLLKKIALVKMADLFVLSTAKLVW